MKQIETLHLFPKLTEALITLLKGLDVDDWKKPSPIKGRTIKDLVSHLIDGSLRRLSLQRDHFSDMTANKEIHSYSDLVDFIQTLNSEWMKATKRLSPELLMDLLAYSEGKLYDFLNTLDPDGEALFSVAWAGESRSLNWFDIAREYTEKWHHQMQIRLALDKPILLEKEYAEPLYDTFMLGLPYLYRDMEDYPENATIKISITDVIQKSWYVTKRAEGWELSSKKDEIVSEIDIPGKEAWIIFTNTDRDKAKYRSGISVKGDPKPGDKLLEFVTVMS